MQTQELATTFFKTSTHESQVVAVVWHVLQGVVQIAHKSTPLS